MRSSGGESTVSCPACGRRYRVREERLGRSVRCRSCGTVFGGDPARSAGAAPTRRVEVRSRRGASTVAARARARRRGDGPEASPATVEDRWASRWSIASGIGILVGLLFPFAIVDLEWRGGSPAFRLEWKWLWELLRDEDAEAKAVLAVAALLGLGIVALVVGRWLRGRRQALTLLVSGSAVFLLSFLVLVSDIDTPVSDAEATTPAGLLLFGTLLVLSTPVLAAGNHLRRSVVETRVPGILTAAAGAVLVACYLLPVFGGRSLLFRAVEQDVWSGGNWPFGVALLSLLAYGILGIVSLSRRLSAPMSFVLTYLARVIVIGYPLIQLVSVLSVDVAGEFKTQALVLSMKFVLVTCGVLAVVGVGLAGSLLPALRRREERLRDSRRMRIVRETF